MKLLLMLLLLLKSKLIMKIQTRSILLKILRICQWKVWSPFSWTWHQLFKSKPWAEVSSHFTLYSWNSSPESWRDNFWVGFLSIFTSSAEWDLLSFEIGIVFWSGLLAEGWKANLSVCFGSRATC